MRPIVLKVLKQEPVSQSEWQELFYGVHLVCLWDEKGATKIYDCLHEDIVAFIDVSRIVSCTAALKIQNLIYFCTISASSSSCFSPTGRTSAFKGIYNRMEKIFHSKQLSTVTFSTIRK